MKAYALDLRERVVNFIKSGGSKAEAARRFDLARSSVYRYLDAAKTGALAPKTSWGHWPKVDPQKLQAQVKQHPDAHPQGTPKGVWHQPSGDLGAAGAVGFHSKKNS